jgi:hypothetical protein
VTAATHRATGGRRVTRLDVGLVLVGVAASVVAGGHLYVVLLAAVLLVGAAQQALP